MHLPQAFNGLPPGLLSLRVASGVSFRRELSVADLHESSCIGTLDHFMMTLIDAKAMPVLYYDFLFLSYLKQQTGKDFVPV